MRSNTIRSKSRNSNRDTEETDSTSQLSRTSTSNGVGGHKRTISGQAPQSSSANSLSTTSSVNTTDPLAAPQRRSTRLINQFSGRFASSTGSLSAKEGREVKKVKATGTKGRSANAFNVGRVVSGNRKHGEMMDVDRKEAKPASNASAVSRNPKPAVSDRVKEFESLQGLLDLLRASVAVTLPSAIINVAKRCNCSTLYHKYSGIHPGS